MYVLEATLTSYDPINKTASFDYLPLPILYSSSKDKIDKQINLILLAKKL